jgi:hypothetical protein
MKGKLGSEGYNVDVLGNVGRSARFSELGDDDAMPT